MTLTNITAGLLCTAYLSKKNVHANAQMKCHFFEQRKAIRSKNGRNLEEEQHDVMLFPVNA